MEREVKSNGSGLVRRARICFCGAVRADGDKCRTWALLKNPQYQALGRQNVSTTGEAHAEQPRIQRHAANDRAAAALRPFSVLSDNVSPPCIERRCFLSLASRCVKLPEFTAGWLTEENLPRAVKESMGDPPCQGICYLFGNVLSHYYVNDFWGLAGLILSADSGSQPLVRREV